MATKKDAYSSIYLYFLASLSHPNCRLSNSNASDIGKMDKGRGRGVAEVVQSSFRPLVSVYSTHDGQLKLVADLSR